ncbi:MAG: gliding motility-associated C-terminal domain-containing protein [Flavobacteriales bacterium]|nr:gliding motility-associated C-terminal domain-containing protein [Flavobacteriales bacterium]
MNSKKRAFLYLPIFIILFTCFFMGGKGYAHDHDPPHLFILNKGQWPAQVQYKTEVSAGNMYFENNRIVYNLWDKSLVSRLHANSEKIDLEKELVKKHNYHVYFDGASPLSNLQSFSKIKQYHNYFLGSDSTKWAGGVPLFEELAYRELYTGIDLKILSVHGQLKYEFEVAPNVNPNQIKLRYEGIDKLRKKGDELWIKLLVGDVYESKPYCYQVVNGEKIEVSCAYKIDGNMLQFDMGPEYNPKHALVIDPTLVFSTFSGSRADNWGSTATYDDYGFLYAGGIVFGQGYDTTLGAFQRTYSGGACDMAISKYDTTGSSMIYSTYLGGSGPEQPQSMIVNENGELFVFGVSGSLNDYPTTLGAFARAMHSGSSTTDAVNVNGIIYPRGSDMVVTRFNNTGTGLIASTYVGGARSDGLNNPAPIITTTFITNYNYADENRGEIELDKFGNVIIASSTLSNNFPMVGSTFQKTFGGGQDGVVFKMSPFLNTITWSTYLGGQNVDAAYSLAIEKNQNIVVVGGTNSPGYFGRPGSAFSSIQGGRTDGFVTIIKSDGSAIVNTTYFGTGFYDQVYFVELDKKGNKYLLGQTEDSTQKLILNATFRTPSAGQFVSKLNPSLSSIVWSTRFGTPVSSGIARPSLSPTAFLVDLCESIYISGWGGNANVGSKNNSQLMNRMDTTSDGFQKTTDGSDFYLMVMDDVASRVRYGTYFGGSAAEHVDGGTSRFDKKGQVYQSVCGNCTPNVTFNPPFPVTPNAHASLKPFAVNCNNAVFKIDFLLPVILADFKAPITVCVNDSFDLENLSKELTSTHYLWDFGNGKSDTIKNPLKYAFDSVGVYEIKLVISDTASCNSTDTLSKFVNVVAPNSSRYPNDTICQGDTIQIGYFNPPWFNSVWSPGASLNDSTIHRPVASPMAPTEYLQLLFNGICADTFKKFIHVDSLVNADYLVDDSVCIPALVKVVNNSIILKSSVYEWNMGKLDTSSALEPSISITKKGTYRIVFSIKDSLSCNKEDSLVKIIVALKDSTYYLPDTSICLGDTIKIGTSQPSKYTYIWSPDSSLDNKNDIQPSAFPWSDTDYELFQIKEVCTDTWRLFVEVDSVLRAEFLIPDSVCVPDTVKLSNQSTIYQGTTYTWDLSGLGNTADFNPTLSINSKGVFKVEISLTDTSTCNLTSKSTKYIEGKSDTSFTLTPQLICNNVARVIGIPNNPSYTYFWNTSYKLGDSTSSRTLARPATDTTYWLHISKGVCVDTAYQKIFKDTISVDAKDRVDVCSFNKITDLTANSFGLASNFHWSNFKNFSDLIPSSKNDSTVTIDPPQFRNRYYIKTTSTRGCTQIDSSTIYISDLGIGVSEDTAKCMHDTVQLFVFSDLPDDKLTAIWTPYKDMITPNDTTHVLVTPTTTRSYYVDVLNYLGCQKKDSIQVTVSTFDSDSASITASLDTIVKIWDTRLTAYPPGFAYAWTPSESLSNATILDPIASPFQTTDYFVTVYDPKYPECKQTATKRVYVEEIYCDEPYVFLPNSFTPNGDGRNEELFIRGKYIKEVKLIIYNRWGEKVFETTDQNLGWDGTFKGALVNPDVFSYYLYVQCIDDQVFEKKGDITVIR